jgi:hypothetical protein
MELPTAQEKSKQIFFAQPKVHQYKFAETNKTVPMDPLWLIAFFEQCQTANKAARVPIKIKKKKQPTEKEMAYLPIACSHDSSYQQQCCKNRDYHQSNLFNCNDQRHDSHHRDNQRHNHSHCKEKDLMKKSSINGRQYLDYL